MQDERADTGAEGAGTTDPAPDQTLPEDLPDPEEEGITAEEREARKATRDQAKADAQAMMAEQKTERADLRSEQKDEREELRGK
jgi:hypothetical protein